MKIATIPIGYADGVRRDLSNNGNVVINGKKAKILGTVCMDSFMVDVTDIEGVEAGDDVYIWDNENITVEEIAKACEICVEAKADFVKYLGILVIFWCEFLYSCKESTLHVFIQRIIFRPITH